MTKRSVALREAAKEEDPCPDRSYGPDPPNRRGTRAYFDVDDINAGAARVKELGGEAGEAMPVPSMGWFSICTDTEGNEFGLWQNDPSAPAPTG